MKQTPVKILHKLMIIIPLFFFIGLLFFFLKDKTIGTGILIGAGISLIIGIIYYYNIKKQDTKSAQKLLTYFYLLGGILLLILGIMVLIFEKESIKNVIYEIILGILLLIQGIYLLKNKQPKKINWKKIPLGFKIIITYFFITIFLNFINISAQLHQPDFILGILIPLPYSLLLTITYFFIPVIMVFFLLQKKGWKILLGTQLFILINNILGTIKIITTPLTELFALVNKPLQKVAPETLQAIESQIKTAAIIPLLIGLIIALIILIYIYKNKKYFLKNNEQKQIKKQIKTPTKKEK